MKIAFKNGLTIEVPETDTPPQGDSGENMIVDAVAFCKNLTAEMGIPPDRLDNTDSKIGGEANSLSHNKFK